MCAGDNAQFIKKGEEFDWLYGLDVLEAEFLSGDNPKPLEEMFKVETVMRYNGLFSRLANDCPGEFRKKDIVWAKRDLDINEQLASCYFDVEFTKQVGLTSCEFFNRENKRRVCLVKKSWLSRRHQQVQVEGYEVGGTDKTKKFLREHWHEINIPVAMDEWLKEQNRTTKLDLIEWLKRRYHYFPLVSTLPEDLERSLIPLKEVKEMHPIEKACRIWFDIVRIHISHEANKRTGKALASVILLKHGYLPPKIKKEDEREYLDALQLGIEEKDGHLRLIDFVAKNILRTQQEYAHLQLQ